LFLVGGAVPTVLGLVMWRVLPESPRYLCTRPERAAELATLLNRVAGTVVASATSKFSGAITVVERSALAAIFSQGLRGDTLILWLIFFTNVFSIYFFFNWLPTVLASAQLDFTVAVSGSFYFNLGGVVSSLATSALIGRYGSRKVLGVMAVAAVVAVAAIAMSPVVAQGPQHGSIAGLMMAMAIAGGCVNSVQIGMFSVAANVYPTQCRSTGVGWGLAIARFGGIVSSFAGAAFFTMGMRPSQFFFFIAAMLVLTLMGVVMLHRHIHPAAATGSHGLH
jgi:AAHS family 4-hydroxybenzoate transporter-like MFS transporter